MVNVPDTLSIRNWMIHRSSLTSNESKNYMEGKMLRSSLEVYLPLTDSLAGIESEIVNAAQSMTKIRLGKGINFRIVKSGIDYYVYD